MDLVSPNLGEGGIPDSAEGKDSLDWFLANGRAIAMGTSASRAGR